MQLVKRSADAYKQELPEARQSQSEASTKQAETAATEVVVNRRKDPVSKVRAQAHRLLDEKRQRHFFA